GGVVTALIALDRRAPRLERPHLEGIALEIVADVVEHFLRVPVLGEQCVAGMHPPHREVPIVHCLGPYVARRAALLPFGDDVALLNGTARARFHVIHAWFLTHVSRLVFFVYT